VAQICQSVRINRDENIIDNQILESALEKHVLIVLQRMKIDVLNLISNKIRSFRIKTDEIETAYQALSEYGAQLISCENRSIILDLDNNITPVEVAHYLQSKGIKFEKVDLIAESEKEFRRIILNW
jgi:hypothetical protein